MPTTQQLRDYLDRQCLNGRGQAEAVLDRRGLQEFSQRIVLSAPLDGETHTPDGKTVFISGRLTETP